MAELRGRGPASFFPALTSGARTGSVDCDRALLDGDGRDGPWIDRFSDPWGVPALARSFCGNDGPESVEPGRTVRLACGLGTGRGVGSVALVFVGGVALIREAERLGIGGASPVGVRGDVTTGDGAGGSFIAMGGTGWGGAGCPILPARGVSVALATIRGVSDALPMLPLGEPTDDAPVTLGGVGGPGTGERARSVFEEEELVILVLSPGLGDGVGRWNTRATTGARPSLSASLTSGVGRSGSSRSVKGRPYVSTVRP